MVGKGERRYQRMLTVIMFLISLIMVIPLVLLVMASITSNNEIVMHGYSFWPKEFSLDAYKYIWNEKAQIFHAYGVTVLVTVLGTAVGTMLTLLYGYVLAQPKFPGKSFLAFYLFFTMLFNGGLVPTYIMYTRYLHLKNSIAALIIPGLLMNAFNVILARTFIQSNVPVALKEAAEIDGASEFRIFGQVALPLCKPIIATVAVFVAVGQWNSWFDNHIYTRGNESLTTLQYLLYNYLNEAQRLADQIKNTTNAAGMSQLVSNSISPKGIRMTITVLASLPIFMVYPFMQKYFVKGIMVGAVKG